MLEWEHDERRDVDAVTAACVLIRREALDDVGLFDERFFLYGEEIDWFLRARRRGWRVVFEPAARAAHGSGKSSDVGASVLSLLLLEGNYTYANKHFGSCRAAVLRLVLAAVDTGRLLVALSRSSRAPRRAMLLRRLVIHAGARAPRPE